jgi:hypothetical protein
VLVRNLGERRQIGDLEPRIPNALDVDRPSLVCGSLSIVRRERVQRTVDERLNALRVGTGRKLDLDAEALKDCL